MKKREKHGGAHTALYGIWNAMKARCTNPNTARYADYGGRGITVCPQWAASFSQFRADMGEPPPGMTLERKDNNKGYEPGNCVWATRFEQGRNRRSTRILEVNGERRSMAEWAALTGVSLPTIWHRIKLGWSEQDAVTIPLITKRKGIKRGEKIHAYAFGAEHAVIWTDPAERRAA